MSWGEFFIEFLNVLWVLSDLNYIVENPACPTIDRNRAKSVWNVVFGDMTMED